MHVIKHVLVLVLELVLVQLEYVLNHNIGQSSACNR